MKIGVIGNGVVGNAVYEGFKTRKHHMYLHDRVACKSLNTLEEIAANCEIIFICVDTPNDAEGAFNGMNVRIAIESLAKQKYEGIIVIKSTVIPGFTDWFRIHHPTLKFAVNPEFLRAKTPYQDFAEPSRIVIGCYNPMVRDKLGMLYSRGWKTPIHYCAPKEAELIKYLSNLFLTLKVAFSEEACRLQQVFPNQIDLPKVLHIVGEDPRIGLSHLLPEGPLPRESPCLPKDLQAFIHHMDLRGYDTWFLKAIQHRAVAKH